jgi:hypothetical protein
VYIARALSHQDEFFAAIDAATNNLPPEVVDVRYALGTDWNGEPAVFFKVILKDDEIPRADLLAVTWKFSRDIVQQLSPLEEWGVLPHFRFLTQTEYERVKAVEPTWA